MFKKSLGLLAGFFAFSATAPAAAERTMLIELFSAENCHSCERAYDTLNDLSHEREDVVVLTWMVDYWNYLGDEPLAIEASKARQSAYVDRFDLRGPYTPQTVYDGVAQCPGSRSKTVAANLKAIEELPPTPVKLQVSGDQIRLSGRSDVPLEVTLVRYRKGNHGPPNAVTSVQQVDEWSGEAATYPVSICPDSCALLVQEKGFGRVHAALNLMR